MESALWGKTSEDVARNILDGRFGIAHTTVQFEHTECAVSENGCSIISPPSSTPT